QGEYKKIEKKWSNRTEGEKKDDGEKKDEKQFKPKVEVELVSKKWADGKGDLGEYGDHVKFGAGEYKADSKFSAEIESLTKMKLDIVPIEAEASAKGVEAKTEAKGDLGDVKAEGDL